MKDTIVGGGDTIYLLLQISKLKQLISLFKPNLIMVH